MRGWPAAARRRTGPTGPPPPPRPGRLPGAEASPGPCRAVRRGRVRPRCAGGRSRAPGLRPALRPRARGGRAEDHGALGRGGFRGAVGVTGAGELRSARRGRGRALGAGGPCRSRRATEPHGAAGRGGLRGAAPVRGRDRRRAVGAGGLTVRLDDRVARFGRARQSRVGRRRRAPGHPAVLLAAEAGLLGAVGAPRGRGLGPVAVLCLGRAHPARLGGGARVLVEEVRAGLLGGAGAGAGNGGRRPGTGRRRERYAVGGRGTARTRYPGGTVPVPDISRNGGVRVIPFTGPVVTGGRGWGAHVRRPVSARGFLGVPHLSDGRACQRRSRRTHLFRARFRHKRSPPGTRPRNARQKASSNPRNGSA